MAAKSQPVMSEALKTVLSDHLEKLRTRILQRATEIASESRRSTSEEESAIAKSGQVEIDLPHLTKALREIEPGFDPDSAPQGIGRQISDAMRSFTAALAIMAIIFAVLGLFALQSNSPAAKGLKNQSDAFLDVAKIFAGAIVGSTGAAVGSRIRRRDR